jgi:nitroimidazol reductase NimA-like FMN-containing flavoprotein (pyridoxamine 5'-phosphate oxidase superfamily)
MSESSGVDVPPHVLEYLRKQATLTLATASATGVPRATTLLYVNDGPVFYVWTQPESTVARHVGANPIVSFAIDEYASDWRETKGVQAAGKAKVVLNPSEVERAAELFREKFSSLGSGPPSNISFFRIEPSDLQFIDGAGASGGPDQAFGFEYQINMVYTVFRQLPPTAMPTIGGRLQSVQAEPGDVIIRQGDPADKFFIIVDGKVEVLREDGGETRKLAELAPGEFFGEIALMRDLSRTATVRALEPTTLLAMERDAFRTLIAESLDTARDFDVLVQKRLDEATARQ